MYLCILCREIMMYVCINPTISKNGISLAFNSGGSLVPRALVPTVGGSPLTLFHCPLGWVGCHPSLQRDWRDHMHCRVERPRTCLAERTPASTLGVCTPDWLCPRREDYLQAKGRRSLHLLAKELLSDGFSCLKKTVAAIPHQIFAFL